MFSWLPASHGRCQAAVRLMQVDGIVLNWMLSFNDLSGTNLAAIFRRAQLLLYSRSAEIYGRSPWEAAVVSCHLLVKRRGKLGPLLRIPFISLLFLGITRSYQWVGCFMPLNVQTTSLVLQQWVRLWSQRHLRPTLVQHLWRAAPPQHHVSQHIWKITIEFVPDDSVFTQKTLQGLCVLCKKTDPACSFPALLFSWYCISSPVCHSLSLTGHMAILCKSAENPLSGYSRQKNRPGEREMDT